MKPQNVIRITTIAGLVFLAGPRLFGADANYKEQRGQLTARDYRFVSEVAHGGTAEVELGELAKQKAASQEVRAFSERMIADHSKANDELKKLASQKGVVLPAELSHKEHSEMKHLQKLNGRDFDKAYAAAMLKDHKADVKEFQSAAKDLNDPDLRAFAQRTLPTLEEHLRMARNLEASAKKE